MSSLFGRLVGAHHVEDAIVAVLKRWYPTYLHEAERASGIVPGSLQKPRSYRITSDQSAMPEDQTPAVIIKSPGILEVPGVNGARQYSARWEIETGILVSAIGTLDNGTPRALRLARIHALALRACVTQQPDQPGMDAILFRRDWIDEGYRQLPSIDDRTICIATVRFSIEVPNVLTSDSGPIEPLVDPDDPDVAPPVPSPEWPVAVTQEVSLVKERLP